MSGPLHHRFDPERVYGPKRGLTPMKYEMLPAGTAYAVDNLQQGSGRFWEIVLQYPIPIMAPSAALPTTQLLIRKMTFCPTYNHDGTWSLMIANEESVEAYCDWIRAWSLRP